MPDKTDHIAALLRQALPRWNIAPDAPVRLINLSENATFRVDPPASEALIIRVHRQGYHDLAAIESEHIWMEEIRRSTDIAVCRAVHGQDGNIIQTVVDTETGLHHMAGFAFISGDNPSEEGDLGPGFRKLGNIAARLHQQVASWDKPSSFKRMSWDLDTVFGADAIWGDWRDAPNHTAESLSVLERVQAKITERLTRFGRNADRFGLIHADMRLANLIEDGDQTWLIDFDDCGFGWYLYDFAAAISFFEDDPRIPALKEAWLDGYADHAALSKDDIAELDSFIMFRRLALLAWIGSHAEAPEPQALAPDFARVTAELGARYLAGNLYPS